jgi:hypothetical protein
MDKTKKTDYLIDGMIVEIRKKPSAKLFNQLIGLKFKSVRLKQKLTADAVVEDNKPYLNSVYDLYKFEKGIKSDASKLWNLSKYYRFDLPTFLDSVITKKEKHVHKT